MPQPPPQKQKNNFYDPGNPRVSFFMTIWYTITGAIDQNTANGLITWVNSQLYSGNVSRLVVFLSSGGGDIDAAIRLYHYLKGIPIEVEIVGFSQIDSAANTIFLAGTKRKALQGCRFFLHEGTFYTNNTSAVLHVHEETLTIFRELLKRTIEIIATETSKSKEEITKILSEGKFYSAEEAVKFGLATEVISKLPMSPNVVPPQQTQ